MLLSMRSEISSFGSRFAFEKSAGAMSPVSMSLSFIRASAANSAPLSGWSCRAETRTMGLFRFFILCSFAGIGFPCGDDAGHGLAPVVESRRPGDDEHDNMRGNLDGSDCDPPVFIGAVA